MEGRLDVGQVVCEHGREHVDRVVEVGGHLLELGPFERDAGVVRDAAHVGFGECHGRSPFRS